MANEEMRNRIHKLLDDSEIDPSILNDFANDDDALNTFNDTLLFEQEKKKNCKSR